jgi:hypothetical protein
MLLDMRRRLWLWLVALCLVAPASAGAALIRVDYRVWTQLVFQGNPIAPGLHGTGVISLLYQASGTSPIAGPVSLLAGSLGGQATLLAGHVPSSMATGGIRIRMGADLGPALGTLKPTGTLLFPLIPVAQTGVLSCVGMCSGMTTSMNPLTGQLAVVWNAPGHLVGGALQQMALISQGVVRTAAQNGFVPIGIHIANAQEIARTVIPEPSSLPLAASGLALLATRRQRRAVR